MQTSPRAEDGKVEKYRGGVAEVEGQRIGCLDGIEILRTTQYKGKLAGGLLAVGRPQALPRYPVLEPDLSRPF